MQAIKCPKCGREDVAEHDVESGFDDKLNKHIIIRTFYCNDCTCEFTEIYVRDETMGEILSETTQPYHIQDEERTK